MERSFGKYDEETNLIDETKHYKDNEKNVPVKKCEFLKGTFFTYVRSLCSLRNVIGRRSDCNPITPNKEILKLYCL